MLPFVLLCSGSLSVSVDMSSLLHIENCTLEGSILLTQQGGNKLNFGGMQL